MQEGEEHEAGSQEAVLGVLRLLHLQHEIRPPGVILGDELGPGGGEVCRR